MTAHWAYLHRKFVLTQISWPEGGSRPAMAGRGVKWSGEHRDPMLTVTLTPQRSQGAAGGRITVILHEIFGLESRHTWRTIKKAMAPWGTIALNFDAKRERSGRFNGRL
uniref:Uncharacterized protein n=1 Tax=Magnetococcus massalia (strain MO-1) TaxID=451514 RepID=A0A1S7LL27_MAGMO|nr:protein of unknown function [Candidatus Magnetococcus massalia]